MKTLRKTLLAATFAALALGIGQAHALDLGAVMSGAKINGNNKIDVQTRDITSLALGGSSKVMIGHISDGSNIGGNSDIRVNTRAITSLALGGSSCIAIGTVGGRC